MLKVKEYCIEHAENSCKWFAELEHLITDNDMDFIPTIWTHRKSPFKVQTYV